MNFMLEKTTKSFRPVQYVWREKSSLKSVNQDHEVDEEFLNCLQHKRIKVKTHPTVVFKKCRMIEKMASSNM